MSKPLHNSFGVFSSKWQDVGLCAKLTSCHPSPSMSFLMLACRAPPDAAPSTLLQCEPSLAQQIAPNWPQFQSGISWHLVPRPVHHKTRNSSQGTGLMCSPIASKTCSTWQPFRACADKYSMMTSSQIKHQGMSKGGTHRRSKKTLGCCGCRRKLV